MGCVGSKEDAVVDGGPTLPEPAYSRNTNVSCGQNNTTSVAPATKIGAAAIDVCDIPVSVSNDITAPATFSPPPAAAKVSQVQAVDRNTVLPTRHSADLPDSPCQGLDILDEETELDCHSDDSQARLSPQCSLGDDLGCPSPLTSSGPGTRQPSFSKKSEFPHSLMGGSVVGIKDGLIDLQSSADKFLSPPRSKQSDPIPEDLQKAYGLTDPGVGRSENQDSYTTSTFRDHRGDEILLTAVFDGHGAEGGKISRRCAHELKRLFDEQCALDLQAQFKANGGSKFGSAGWPSSRFITANLGGSVGHISGRTLLMNQEFSDREERLLNLLFHALEEELREECNTVLSGTTGSVCLLKKGVTWVASVGDSSAIVISQEGAEGEIYTTVMSGDHRLTNDDEKARVIACGARVARRGYASKGHFRIWLQELDTPGLMVTRSLGDTIGKTVGVTNEPEVRVKELEPADRYIVLGSDGVWDVISVEEAAAMIMGATSAEAATELLVNEALARWQRKKDETEAKYNRSVSGIGDNVTALVIDIQGW
eukprot:CAMPEP_0117675216 /NCGR_PEP_ID=MMETSP0804-20121206/15481_1 /TAXON_ID=1074897 /ORGANISM="Tetraselmis astigmatica, Strain CCMP880" /LENGTH=537 /DNA_ID=CAMNT_0005484193 /DNA_START=333 /DNA_END=1943 /DNA_ORIENTATION=-